MTTNRIFIHRPPRSGLSLLEVILSIAILGGAMVVIGALVNLGYRSAAQAKIRSDANILVNTKMSEVVAGVLPLESTSAAPIEENPQWKYSVEVEEAQQLGLLLLTVYVEQANAANPIGMSVVRLVPDPDYDPNEDVE